MGASHLPMNIILQRVYDPPSPACSARVLVDRLWPRGIARDEVTWDTWCRDIAPSGELREWFHRDHLRWDEFCQRYYRELDEKRAVIKALMKLARCNTLVLLYSSRDREHNQAQALRQYLMQRMKMED